MPKMANPALEIAETIQTASINFHPSPEHDINPSTAASTKVPVTTSDPPGNDDVEDETHVSILRPQRRKNTLPPLPDLRFEQSYLASIKGAETSGQVAWITIRDQVFLPLMQGTLWSLALHGWRYWNRNASFSGKTLGSRIRRWWFGVNNWKIPETKNVPENELAAQVEEFYKDQFSSAGID